jgi:hypothetical protein
MLSCKLRQNSIVVLPHRAFIMSSGLPFLPCTGLPTWACYGFPLCFLNSLPSLVPHSILVSLCYTTFLPSFLTWDTDSSNIRWFEVFDIRWSNIESSNHGSIFSHRIDSVIRYLMDRISERFSKIRYSVIRWFCAANICRFEHDSVNRWFDILIRAPNHRISSSSGVSCDTDKTTRTLLNRVLVDGWTRWRSRLNSRYSVIFE